MKNWSSWSDFLSMNGYALYVWGSIGMCAAVVAGELLMLRLRRRALLREMNNQSPADAAHPVD